MKELGKAVAFFLAVYWMHLHRSFDDGWSPSSTKRQSSASTSCAWIMLSTVCGDGGQPFFEGWWLWFKSGAGAASCAVCRAARLGGPSPKAALRKGCVWLPRADGFLHSELEESVRRRTSLRLWRNEERASGDKTLEQARSRCAGSVLKALHAVARADHAARAIIRPAAAAALSSSARRSSHRLFDAQKRTSDPSASDGARVGCARKPNRWRASVWRGPA